jgi:hypothetical protein
LTAEPGKSIAEDTEKTLPGFPLASVSSRYAAMQYTDSSVIAVCRKNSEMKTRILNII